MRKYTKKIFMEFEPSLIGCMITAANYSYDLIAKSKQCVIFWRGSRACGTKACFQPSQSDALRAQYVHEIASVLQNDFTKMDTDHNGYINDFGLTNMSHLLRVNLQNR
jgi:hypothetical protein